MFKIGRLDESTFVEPFEIRDSKMDRLQIHPDLLARRYAGKFHFEGCAGAGHTFEGERSFVLFHDATRNGEAAERPRSE